MSDARSWPNRTSKRFRDMLAGLPDDVQQQARNGAVMLRRLGVMGMRLAGCNVMIGEGFRRTHSAAARRVEGCAGKFIALEAMPLC